MRSWLLCVWSAIDGHGSPLSVLSGCVYTVAFSADWQHACSVTAPPVGRRHLTGKHNKVPSPNTSGTLFGANLPGRTLAAAAHSPHEHDLAWLNAATPIGQKSF